MNVEGDYVECWFIGGPWKDQLRQIHDLLVRDPGIPLRVFGPDDHAWAPAAPTYANAIDPFNHGGTVYYQQSPLETGVPVYSCLPYAESQIIYTRFGLRSVTRS